MEERIEERFVCYCILKKKKKTKKKKQNKTLFPVEAYIFSQVMKAQSMALQLLMIKPLGFMLYLY